MNTDFVYYIELNGEIDAMKPFSSYDEAYEYLIETGMYSEGKWEIVEWPVD